MRADPRTKQVRAVRFQSAQHEQTHVSFPLREGDSPMESRFTGMVASTMKVGNSYLTRRWRNLPKTDARHSERSGIKSPSSMRKLEDWGWMLLYRPLLCAFFLLGSASSTFAKPPNVILITLDTTRADRMGFLNSKSALTPSLDSLARQSSVFTRAYSQVPLTTPSHATILTGTFPQFNNVNDLGSPLGSDLPYIPEILRQQGYHTAAFVGSQVLDPKGAGAPGFDRGFETYDAPFHSRGPGEDRYQSVERKGMKVVDSALAWLNQNARSPFFLWLHF